MSAQNESPDGQSSSGSRNQKLQHAEAVEGDDDSLEERMLALVAEHARERAKLAEQIGLLQIANEALRRKEAAPNQANQGSKHQFGISRDGLAKCYRLTVSSQRKG